MNPENLTTKKNTLMADNEITCSMQVKLKNTARDWMK